MTTPRASEPPSRTSLLPTYLAWTFGITWGLALVSRLLLGRPDTPGGALHVSEGVAAASWLVVILVICLIPILVGTRLARRWRIPISEWGWTEAPRTILWGPAVALGVFAVVCAAALIVRPEGWEPPWIALWRRPAVFDFNVGSIALALGLELGFRGVVQTELGRLGFMRSTLGAALASGVWVLVAALVLGGGVHVVEAKTDTLRFLSVGVSAAALMGWVVVASWLRVRTGSVFTSALMFVTWGWLNDWGGSPLHVVDSDAPFALDAVVACTLVVAAIVAFMYPPRAVPLPEAANRSPRAENLLAGPPGRSQ